MSKVVLYVPWRLSDGRPIFVMTVPRDYEADGRFVPPSITAGEDHRIKIDAREPYDLRELAMSELAEPFDVPACADLKAGDHIFFDYTPKLNTPGGLPVGWEFRYTGV